MRQGLSVRQGSFVLVLAALGALAVGCKKDNKAAAPETRPLRVGYFPNITHGQALVGQASGAYSGVELKAFNAGPAAMEALSAGSLDASYVGTGPAINTFLKGGRELRILAAAANGGAVLVTKTARSPAELAGKKLASPQLGNSQDIALRTWLGRQGLKVDKDVSITPLANPDILGLFLNGQLEGAWVPEPWGARMVAEGGGHILLDERELWPGGRFHTTVLVTTRKALEQRRPQLKQLVRVHVALTREWQQNPQAFSTRVNTAFTQVSGHPISPPVLQDAFSRLEPAMEVLPAQLQQAASHAQALGFISSSDLTGLVDTSLLEEVLKEAEHDGGP
jgi:NitT/TauT family transport system substrate-binding protein